MGVRNLRRRRRQGCGGQAGLGVKSLLRSICRRLRRSHRGCCEPYSSEGGLGVRSPPRRSRRRFHGPQGDRGSLPHPNRHLRSRHPTTNPSQEGNDRKRLHQPALR